MDYVIAFEEKGIIKHLLNQSISKLISSLNYFFEKQFFNPDFKLPSYILSDFNDRLTTTKISPEYKIFFLKLYIIVREDEFRKNNRQEYNSPLAQFFQPHGGNARAKLNAAKALLNDEPNLRKRSALQFGRLGKIAALFLNESKVNSSKLAI